MKWLVKFADNWADEMDVEGFAVLGTKDFMGLITLIENVAKKIDEGKTFEWYIGTNEWIDYNEGSQFKTAFSCEVISEEQAEILKSLVIGDTFSHYGILPSSTDMTYFLEDVE